MIGMGAEEPTLTVKLEGKQTSMLVDTGACYTCVNSEDATHLPMSDKFIETIGFSGTKQVIQMTAPVKLKIKDKEIKIPILVSSQTPINLLGRDALCKLNIKIWCSPLGMYVDREALQPQMPIQQSEKAKVYWLGDILEPVTLAVQKWEEYIKSQIPDASRPRLDPHCTVYYDASKSTEFEAKWDRLTKGKKVELITKYMERRGQQ